MYHGCKFSTYLAHASRKPRNLRNVIAIDIWNRVYQSDNRWLIGFVRSGFLSNWERLAIAIDALLISTQDKTVQSLSLVDRTRVVTRLSFCNVNVPYGIRAACTSGFEGDWPVSQSHDSYCCDYHLRLNPLAHRTVSGQAKLSAVRNLSFRGFRSPRLLHL